MNECKSSAAGFAHIGQLDAQLTPAVIHAAESATITELKGISTGFQGDTLCRELAAVLSWQAVQPARILSLVTG